MNATAIRQAVLAITAEAATCESEDGRQAVLEWAINKLAAEAGARVVITRGGLDSIHKLADALLDAIRVTAWTTEPDVLEDVVGKHIDRLYVKVWGDPDEADNIYLALV